MKRTLRGNGRQTMPNMDEMKNAAQNADPAMLNNVQNVIDKYGNKSEAELMSELAAAKRSGLIDPNELASVAGRIAPMLTAEQKKRLESVLQQLQ